mmetsp:Transcript_7372/g.19123  ORF Transcript_7372/g.19123 Transcript_7372/m.19123 type:complete len:154 (+) Transcript_7372:264-725(+)
MTTSILPASATGVQDGREEGHLNRSGVVLEGKDVWPGSDDNGGTVLFTYFQQACELHSKGGQLDLKGQRLTSGDFDLVVSSVNTTSKHIGYFVEVQSKFVGPLCNILRIAKEMVQDIAAESLVYLERESEWKFLSSEAIRQRSIAAVIRKLSD